RPQVVRRGRPLGGAAEPGPGRVLRRGDGRGPGRLAAGLRPRADAPLPRDLGLRRALGGTDPGALPGPGGPRPRRRTGPGGGPGDGPRPAPRPLRGGRRRRPPRPLRPARRLARRRRTLPRQPAPALTGLLPARPAPASGPCSPPASPGAGLVRRCTGPSSVPPCAPREEPQARPAPRASRPPPGPPAASRGHALLTAVRISGRRAAVRGAARRSPRVMRAAP